MAKIVITLVFITYNTLFISAMDNSFHFSRTLPFSDPGFPGLKIFESLFDVSIRSCMECCKLRQQCDYFNYHYMSHMCLMLTSDGSSVQSYPDVGMLYGNKSEWDMTAYQACNTCPENATCILTAGAASCIYTGCGPPTVPPGISILGNLYSIGARLVFRCEHDYTISVTVECGSDGTWSDPNISCTEQHFMCTGSQVGETQTYPLLDCTNYTIWLSPNRTDIPTANGTCNNLGGRLAQMSTVERFNATVEMILCAGDDRDWYVGGTHAGDGIYITDDGDTIPASLLGATNFDKPCLKMKRSNGYKMDHDVCTHDHDYICEILDTTV